MDIHEVRNFLRNLKSTQIKKIVLSDRADGEFNKLVIRPVEIKNQLMFQREAYANSKIFHANLGYGQMIDEVNFSNFKQILVETIGKNYILNQSKNRFKLKEKSNDISINDIKTTHNKTKNFLINEGDDVPIMVELGIFTKENKIVRSMYDKFKQINRFIELIDDAYKNSKLKDITILDFGCGKSYLTFLIYHYFVNIKKIKAKIIGYDIKKDVVENCNNLAKKYNYDGLEFVLSDVSKDELFHGKIDTIISLHACNTATDYALNFAIKNKVKNIFSVPCCQHEINQTIHNGGDFDILLKDGLIKERFSALLTDEIRVQILRALGYEVDVIEFVDFAHSPKNIMIRAELKHGKNNALLDELIKLKKKYNFNQTLLNLINVKNDAKSNS